VNQNVAGSKGQLIRGIGILGGALLVLNGMIGAGIFALTSAVAVELGTFSPWLFLAAGVLIITVVLTFAELSSYFRISGGPVLYATRAFGSLIGFSTGWIYYVSRVAALAANSNAMAIYLGALSPWFGIAIGRAAGTGQRAGRQRRIAHAGLSHGAENCSATDHDPAWVAICEPGDLVSR
jgi:APA family basic amino acid/polyamine antiporter